MSRSFIFSQSASELGPGAKLIKAKESPTICPSCHAPKGQPPPCQLPAFNWVLTSLYFTVSIIPISVLSSSPSPFLSPSPPFTAATTNTFFVFQRVSTFSILRCEIHFDSGLEMVEPAICPYLFLPVFLSLSLFSYYLQFFLFESSASLTSSSLS